MLAPDVHDVQDVMCRWRQDGLGGLEVEVSTKDERVTQEALALGVEGIPRQRERLGDGGETTQAAA